MIDQFFVRDKKNEVLLIYPTWDTGIKIIDENDMLIDPLEHIPDLIKGKDEDSKQEVIVMRSTKGDVQLVDKDTFTMLFNITNYNSEDLLEAPMVSFKVEHVERFKKNKFNMIQSETKSNVVKTLTSKKQKMNRFQNRI